jgi:hypothetical protein
VWAGAKNYRILSLFGTPQESLSLSNQSKKGRLNDFNSNNTFLVRNYRIFYRCRRERKTDDGRVQYGSFTKRTQLLFLRCTHGKKKIEMSRVCDEGRVNPIPIYVKPTYVLSYQYCRNLPNTFDTIQNFNKSCWGKWNHHFWVARLGSDSFHRQNPYDIYSTYRYSS